MSSTDTGYVQHYAEEAKSWSDQCCNEVARAVDENPTGTLLTAFGAGLGIGLALGLSVAMSAAKPKPRSRAEELSQRILDSIHEYLPDSISRRMG